MNLNQAIPNVSATPKAQAPWILCCLGLTMLLSSLGTSIANVALPTLTVAFDVSFQQVQWVVLAYLLVLTTMVISVGRLGDLLGRRTLMLCGLAVFIVASLACGFVSTLWQLILGRAVQGFGAAIMMALTMAIASDVFPKEKMGRTLGLLGTMSAVGTALGPSMGGLLIETFGWRSIFLVNIPFGFVALMLAWHCLPKNQLPSDKRGLQFDYAGTLLLASSLAAYALAMTLGRGHFGLTNLVLLVVAGLGLVAFLIAEARVKSPLVHLHIFHNRVLGAGFVASALVATVVMATLVVGPFYLSDALLLSPSNIGMVASCGPVVSALVGLPAGRLVDRFGAGILSVAGLGAMLIGTIALAFVPINFGIAGYLLPLVITTAGYALFQVANNTSVMTAIDNDHRGVVSGMLNLSRNLGLISGASLMGAVYMLASTRTPIEGPRLMAEAGMHASFAVAAMLILLALGVSIFSTTTRNQE